MKIVGILFASLLAILLVPSTVAAAILFSAQLKLYSASTYESALNKQDAYARAPELVMDTLAGGSGGGEAGGPSPADITASLGLPKEKVDLILRRMMPPEVLEETLEPVIAQMVVYARGGASVMTVDGTHLKEAARANLPAALAEAQDGLPECTAQQFQTGLATSFGCRPAPDLNSGFVTKVAGAFDQLLQEYPDQQTVDLDKDAGAGTPTAEQRKQVHLGLQLSPLLPLAVFLLIAACTIRSWRGACLWFGIPVLISGLIVAGAGLFSRGLSPDFIAGQIANESQGGGGAAAAFMSDFSATLAVDLSEAVAISGAILAVAGLATLIAGMMMAKSPGETVARTN